MTLFDTREDPDTSFDWFKSYSDLAAYIRPLLPDKTARILMLGCGNSKFSEDVGETRTRESTTLIHSFLDVGGRL